MKKTIIISVYFLLFWIILPGLLIAGSGFLDRTLFSGLLLPVGCKVAGLIILIFGFLMMLVSVWQFRHYSQEFPVSATPPDGIIQKGFFSVWRHPIYFFAIITIAGLALTLRSNGFVFVMLPVFILAVMVYVRMEENSLILRFVPAYGHYKRRVGLIIPRLRHWLKIPAFIVFKIGFGIRIYNKKNIPGSPPFFIVASHRNYLDPFFISYAIPWPVKHISTFEMFRKNIHRKIFPILGAIARKRFSSDIRMVIEMKRAIDQGYPVGIFPEGERSWTGSIQSFKPETLRMFKKFKHIPILPVRLEGNYLSWPRWSPRMLRAKVKVTFEPIVRVDENTDDIELERILIERIEPRKDIEQSIACKSKNLTGNLSRVLYRCPECRAFDSLHEIPPHMLQCNKCKQLIEIDHRFNLKYTLNQELHSGSIADLFDIVKVNKEDLVPLKNPKLAEAELQLLAGQVLYFCTESSFFIEENNAFNLIGQGMICLTDTGICFFHNNATVDIPFNKLGAATIESYCKLQLYMTVEKLLYQVVLKNQSILKWQDTIVLQMKLSGLKKPITR